MTTLLPYRTPAGPVLLRAERVDDAAFELSWATINGPWHPFADLSLDLDADEGDPEISFDPMLNLVPGLEPYDWVRRLT